MVVGKVTGGSVLSWPTKILRIIKRFDLNCTLMNMKKPHGVNTGNCLYYVSVFKTTVMLYPANHDSTIIVREVHELISFD